MNVYIVGGGDGAYRRLFAELGFLITSSMQKADLVCFTGGADVSPSYYGAEKHETTWSDKHRDEEEASVFEDALFREIPMVGICRGGQFLNVMSGGEMYQDVNKHAIHGTHEITDLQTGEKVQVTSTHHQMMKPSPRGLLVASSGLGGYREWWEGGVFAREQSQEDVEVVYYEHTNALCFQPHPEFAGYPAMQEYFASLIRRFLIKE